MTLKNWTTRSSRSTGRSPSTRGAASTSRWAGLWPSGSATQSELLDAVPAGAVESFAGVGYFFDLAALHPGERVLDLGSGSGTDAFAAAPSSDPPDGSSESTSPVNSWRRLAGSPPPPASIRWRVPRAADRSTCRWPTRAFDCVISNGVINLSADKEKVFAEAARVLRPGGRLAIADIVTEQQLTDAIVANADLWASCIGGAAQQDTYRALIESAGLVVREVRRNHYKFISDQARSASARYGVKSISLLATKT